MQRLQTAQTHPDADLLAAFCEQTLGAREREQVLLHLADCESCREVTALAFPETQEVAAAHTAASASFWKWPVMRWGVVAASAIIVLVAVSIGTLDRQRQAEQIQSSNSDVTPLAVPSTPAPSEAAPAAAKQDAGAEEAKQATNKAAESVKEHDKAEARLKAKDSSFGAGAPVVVAKAPTASRGQELAKQDHVEKAPSELAGLADRDAGLDRKETSAAVGGAAPIARAIAPAAVPSARADDSAANVGTTGAMKMAKAAPGNGPLVAGDTPASPAAARESVEVAASAATVKTNQTDDYRRAGSLAEMAAIPSNKKMAAASKDEKPQRPLAKASESLTASTAYQYNALSNEWKVTPQGDLLNSSDLGQNWVQQLPGQKFTHVQSVRSHVWACGPNGMLMHSSDAGLTWTQVKPSSKDTTMQGEIISINFADENRGVVKTSARETWSTTDGGKSWRKQ